jgi:hypothetical protein
MAMRRMVPNTHNWDHTRFNLGLFGSPLQAKKSGLPGAQHHTPLPNK